MSYQKGACGLNRMDGESNKSVYGKFGLSFKSDGMNCGVVEMIQCSKHPKMVWSLGENSR